MASKKLLTRASDKMSSHEMDLLVIQKNYLVQVQVDQRAAHTDHFREMESDTMDPRAIQGDVHLPEDEIKFKRKFKRKFTQMSISVAGYPSMELVSYPVSDDWIEDTDKETCSKYYRLCMKALGLNKGGQDRDVNGNLHVYMVEGNWKKHPANLDFLETEEAKLMALQKVEKFKDTLSEKISEKLVPTIVDMEPYLPTDFSEQQDLWNHFMAQ